ncbi:MAG: hypothetical protein V4671_11745 [Armatimonadota bacterium]
MKKQTAHNQPCGNEIQKIPPFGDHSGKYEIVATTDSIDPLTGLRFIRHYGNDCQALMDAIHIFVTAPFYPNGDAPTQSLSTRDAVGSYLPNKAETAEPATRRRNTARKRSKTAEQSEQTEVIHAAV